LPSGEAWLARILFDQLKNECFLLTKIVWLLKIDLLVEIHSLRKIDSLLEAGSQLKTGNILLKISTAQ
jgi:hypothetical protein